MHLSYAVELPPRVWTLAAARRVVGELLERAAVSPTIRDDLAIVVTEACSNVLRHAPDSGSYRLAVDIDDERCLIEVQDAGPGFDPDLPPNTSHDGGGGRGLILMRALVDDLRVEQRRPGVTVTMIRNLRA